MRNELTRLCLDCLIVKECIVGHKHFNYDSSTRTMSRVESSRVFTTHYALNSHDSIEESCLLEKKLQANVTLPLSCTVYYVCMLFFNKKTILCVGIIYLFNFTVKMLEIGYQLHTYVNKLMYLPI